MVRTIKVRTGYCCINIRRTVVSIVKDNSDLDSWFSAKPIIVGNSSNIFAGTELHLRQGVKFKAQALKYIFFVYIGGS